MRNRKNNKRALIVSALSLLLCVSMLVGSTFAWFTDNASTSVNRIVAGTLDIELQRGIYSANNYMDNPDSYENLSDESLVPENILWEPGYLWYDNLIVRNVGSLNAKFKVNLVATSEVGELAEVIDVYVSGMHAFVDTYGTDKNVRDYIDGKYVGTGSAWDAFDALNPPTKVGTLADVINGQVSLFAEEIGLAPNGGENLIAIALKMQESAGNKYQGKAAGSFDIKVYAAQDTVEEDSFDNQYDADAKYDEADKWDGAVGDVPAEVDGTIVINTAAEFAAFAQSGDTYEGKTVKLNNSIDLGGLDWTSINNFAGTFDGQGNTISNLKDAALFGTVNGTVKNLNLSNVSATTAIKGFLGEVLNGTVENVAVKDADVTLEGYLSYFGGLVGDVGAGAVIDGCSVNGLTITVTGTDNGNNVGGLVGYVKGTAESKVKISNSTVTNVTIDATHKTKCFGGFAGDIKYATLKDCTATNVTIDVDNYFYMLGGFAGQVAEGTELDNCDVVGATFDVAGSGRMGGFVGRTRNTVKNAELPMSFKNCDVTGLDMTVGGIIDSHISGFSGNTTGEAPTTMENCSVEGKIDIIGATIGSKATVNKVTKQDHANDSINCTENVTIIQN